MTGATFWSFIKWGLSLSPSKPKGQGQNFWWQYFYPLIGWWLADTHFLGVLSSRHSEHIYTDNEVPMYRLPQNGRFWPVGWTLIWGRNPSVLSVLVGVMPYELISPCLESAERGVGREEPLTWKSVPCSAARLNSWSQMRTHVWVRR